MRVVTLVVYLIILRKSSASVILIIASIESTNIVTFIKELEVPILEHAVDECSNE